MSEHFRFLFEIKGFGPHVRDMDRKGYCEELNREIFLQAVGFRVVSFPYDDVAHRPDLCITLLRMLLNRYQPCSPPVDRKFIIEKEVLRLTMELAGGIRPKDVTEHFGVNHRTAVCYLQNLCLKGWLQPAKGNEDRTRITRYELVHGVWEYID